MTSNDEIYLSYLCDQILVACNRIHKKLDKYDDFLSSYTTPVISYHEHPSWHVATDVVQPRPPPDPPNGQPWNYVQPGYQHYNHHQPLTAAYGQPPYASFDSGVNNTCWPPAPVTCSLLQPTIASSVILHNPTPQVSMVPDPFQQQPPQSCWSPTNHHHHAVYCGEPPTDLHQHHTYGQEHHQHHQIQQLVQPGDAYWQLHHQCQESMLDQQPPPQHFHSYWHPPSPHSETMPAAAISLPCSPDVSGEEEELFEEEPPLPARIPLPCGPNQVCVDEDEVLPHHLEFFQDYSDHTSVPIELVDAMEYGHLGKRNDRIRDIGDRDRVYEKESLVLGEEEKRTDAFVDVEIIDEPIYTMLEVMKMVDDENSLAFQANGSHFETMLPLSRRLSMVPNGVYNWTEQSCIFDPGGDISPKLLLSTLFIVSWFPP